MGARPTIAVAVPHERGHRPGAEFLECGAWDMSFSGSRFQLWQLVLLAMAAGVVFPVQGQVPKKGPVPPPPRTPVPPGKGAGGPTAKMPGGPVQPTGPKAVAPDGPQKKGPKLPEPED